MQFIIKSSLAIQDIGQNWIWSVYLLLNNLRLTKTNQTNK